MADIKQTIFDIERCICHVPDACRDCSHYGFDRMECMESLLKDALELLKEQQNRVKMLRSEVKRLDVDIVRCKDCNHLKNVSWNDEPMNICLKHTFVGCREDDWFCADGERK